MGRQKATEEEKPEEKAETEEDATPSPCPKGFQCGGEERHYIELNRSQCCSLEWCDRVTAIDNVTHDKGHEKVRSKKSKAFHGPPKKSPKHLRSELARKHKHCEFD